jgi:hypothetical protein
VHQSKMQSGGIGIIDLRAPSLQLPKLTKEQKQPNQGIHRCLDRSCSKWVTISILLQVQLRTGGVLRISKDVVRHPILTIAEQHLNRGRDEMNPLNLLQICQVDYRPLTRLVMTELGSYQRQDGRIPNPDNRQTYQVFGEMEDLRSMRHTPHKTGKRTLIHLRAKGKAWYPCQRVAMTNQVEDLLPFHPKHQCALLQDM